MTFKQTKFKGLFQIVPRVHRDSRGEFVKTFQRQLFQDIMGVNFEIAEEFYSSSRQGVLRGMHFQMPPTAHQKLVYCAAGSVLDVIVDLRRSSPTYGQAHSEELNDRNRHAMFIPEGFAHGFLALSSAAVMFYVTDTVHSPIHDAGIRWNSFGFSWGIDTPIISQRDESLPALADFASPF